MFFGDIIGGIVSVALLGYLAFALTRREQF
jgi:K+-transporting ATPase KdpF subunit